jgi:hypothetical protein
LSAEQKEDPCGLEFIVRESVWKMKLEGSQGPLRQSMGAVDRVWIFFQVLHGGLSKVLNRKKIYSDVFSFFFKFPSLLPSLSS